MNDVAISTVIKYIEEKLFPPDIKWPKEIFKERTYSRWSAYEIIRRLMDRPFDMPDAVIDDFIIDMVIRTRRDDCDDRGYIFEPAIDTAEDIRNLFVY